MYEMDVYDRMRRVINNNYMQLLTLDPGLIASHMKSVLSEGGADHYEKITLPGKTRQEQCAILLDVITMHDKWWTHFIEALQKCGKKAVASLFTEELRKIEQHNEKISKTKRHTSAQKRHKYKSNTSPVDADSAFPSASSEPVLQSSCSRRGSDDWSLGNSVDKDKTGFPVRPKWNGDAGCGRNLACEQTDLSVAMEQNRPNACGQIAKSKQNMYLECDRSNDRERTYTLDTPLGKAPGTFITKLYRHLDSETRMGNYKDLAGELGFTLDELSTLVNTESVIQRFSQVHPKKATFRFLMEALHKLERKDVLEDIRKLMGLVLHVQEQEELHGTSGSTRTLNRNCETNHGKVPDMCGEVPDDPGVIPSDIPYAAQQGGLGLPSNIRQKDKLDFSGSDVTEISKAITIPTKKTDHYKTSESDQVIEDDFATAVHLEQTAMNVHGQKAGECIGVHSTLKMIPTDIQGNIDDGAKPEPIHKVLPCNSGTGARPKLYPASHDPGEMYLPPEDINCRPTRKQLSYREAINGERPSQEEADFRLHTTSLENTEHQDQTLVPTQGRQLTPQLTNIPNFNDILVTKTVSRETADYQEKSTSEEPSHTHCTSWSQYSENPSVHDKLAKEVLEKQELRDGYQFELQSLDGRTATPDTTPLDRQTDHTRGKVGTIQGLESGKPHMSLGPCLPIDDSESEPSSMLGTDDERDDEMGTGRGSLGNRECLVNQQSDRSDGVERQTTSFFPNLKRCLMKLAIHLHAGINTNTLPNWHA